MFRENRNLSEKNKNKWYCFMCFTHFCRSVWVLAVGLIFIKMISVFTGLIMYARYHKCDPIAAHVSFDSVFFY